MTEKVEFSRSTLEVFDQLLNQVQIPVAHPDFETASANAALAKRELAEALKQLSIFLPMSGNG